MHKQCNPKSFIQKSNTCSAPLRFSSL